MNLLYPHCLACVSFSKKFVRRYFTTLNIIKGFFISILFSLFLFFEFFGLKNSLFYVLVAFLGFFYLFRQKKEVYFFVGFFVGLFWFYWISISFIHYGFAYLMPLGILGACLICAFMFLLSAVFSENIFIRAILLFLIVSFVHPLGFNWLDFRLLLLDTFFGTEYFNLLGFMLAIACLVTCKRYFKLLAIPFLLVALIDDKKPLHVMPFDIKLVQSNISQEDKWDKNLRQKHINDNIKIIDEAIKNKKRAIVFPESAFPIYLNRAPKIVEFLKNRSKNIAIIAGALTYKDEKFYNSTYLFDKGQMKIFNKVILVPFGEEIPLPSFMKRWINDTFYDGAEDFSTAKAPQDYEIDGVKIRNAICYEATNQALYENSPKFMIAISNNAWFTPSSEPLLQHLLLRLYAKNSNTTIYHSVNRSKSEIIYP